MPIKHQTTPLTPELTCSNLRISLNFYTEILGFKIQYQRVEEGFAMLERQGSRIMLDEIAKNTTNKIGRNWLAGELEKPFGRGINLQIETNKIDELYEHIKRAGAQIFLPLEEKWYRADAVELGQRQFIVLDPDGYMLRFFQKLGELHRNEIGRI